MANFKKTIIYGLALALSFGLGYGLNYCVNNPSKDMIVKGRYVSKIRFDNIEATLYSPEKNTNEKLVLEEVIDNREIISFVDSDGNNIVDYFEGQDKNGNFYNSLADHGMNKPKINMQQAQKTFETLRERIIRETNAKIQ